ncbi:MULTISPECIES: GNAT family N-acetyltransferase [unclassified Microbulbifer]|uniref:GNAT family N-acetyltransferase n=1 Tax=Microbulbifer spongiae TaxID=2944933 RepID=A0ABY9E7K5_9GAMM|nr:MULTISPECIES: GNAT family N-acetyltransferase [unclassified Microbulbifer]MDP5208944.1 GNAT family N-acetyltransferase [Microbulbifer sp. 2205BS26-8]WKD48311.1 GNAT family N-acetyltransferase [Microbulbifer sp. MI-G]
MAIVVRTANWHSERSTIRTIRETVFVREQKVPADLEWDTLEESAQHFLVFEDGVAIGTGRLTAGGKIGRLAIKKSARGLGYGAQLLETICEHARHLGHQRVYLHAQQQAQGFYSRSGFVVEGDIFSEANIPHIRMVRDLDSLSG